MANFDLTGLALSMVCPTNQLITLIGADVHLHGPVPLTGVTPDGEVIVPEDELVPALLPVDLGAGVLLDPLSALLAGGDSSIHPAFLINGIQHDKIAIGKFQAKTHSNRAYSLPGITPCGRPGACGHPAGCAVVVLHGGNSDAVGGDYYQPERQQSLRCLFCYHRCGAFGVYTVVSF